MKRDLKGLVKRGVKQSGDRPNQAIERIMLSAAGLSRQPTEAHVLSMADAAAAAFKPLVEVAMSGNVHAIRRVTELASTLCDEAMMLACMHQDAANQVARQRTTWPLNVSPDPVERRRTLRLVTGPRRLPIGETSPAPRRARKNAALPSTPANAAVLMALKAIQIERAFRVPSELFPTLQPEWSVAASRLPDLHASVADPWFEVIWMHVCQRHEGAPEHSVLRKLADDGDAAKPAGPVSEHAVRTAIRQKLRQAFLRMVRGKR